MGAEGMDLFWASLAVAIAFLGLALLAGEPNASPPTIVCFPRPCVSAPCQRNPTRRPTFSLAQPNEVPARSHATCPDTLDRAIPHERQGSPRCLATSHGRAGGVWIQDMGDIPGRGCVKT